MKDLRVADVIRRHASERPQAVALRHGARELSYAELDERSNRLAQALLAQGVGAGTRVAYLDRSSPEVVELLFAASKVGAVLVPLNWRLAVPELAAVLADSEAPVLIAGPAFREIAEHVRPLGPLKGCRTPILIWSSDQAAGANITAVPSAASSTVRWGILRVPVPPKVIVVPSFVDRSA